MQILLNLISVKLRIRTSSSQFILAEDQSMCSVAGAVASDSSIVEKTAAKQLEPGAKVNGKGGGGGQSTVEPMDTEEKQTSKQYSSNNILSVIYWHWHHIQIM